MRYYRRTIVYTKCPLKEAFQYKDVFTIQPITRSDVPHSPYAKDYPLFLDYSFETDEVLNEYTLVQKDIDESKRICAILTALSNFEFFIYNSSMQHWGIVAPSISFEEMTKEEVERINEESRSSKWIPCAAYTYPEYAHDRIISSISILEGNTEMELDEDVFYFTDNPVQEQKDRVSFQAKIKNALDTLYALDKKKQQSVLSAIVLIADGIRLGLHHQSLGFISFISSIETMIDLENKGVKIEPCKECGQPVYSVNKKFLAYLSKYVSRTEASQKKFKRLYTLRSKIAHAGKLFLSDMEFTLLNQETTDKEWFTYMEAQQLARLSLYRWLLLYKKQ